MIKFWVPSALLKETTRRLQVNDMSQSRFPNSIGDWTPNFSPFDRLSLGSQKSMEIEGQDGSKTELRNNFKTVFGRGSGFNTNDRTVSRRHVVFQLEAPPPLDKAESQPDPRVSFQVVGKNPVWVRTGTNSKEIKVFRRFEEGEAVSGDSFCISSKIPVWFHFLRTGTKLGLADEMDLESQEENELGIGNSQVVDLSQIDPVKEFGFLVIGQEFECYPLQRIGDVKNWDWFLKEQDQDGDEEDDDCEKKKRGGSRKRKKSGGNDDDWTSESEDDKDLIAKTGKVEGPKYLTRSKDRKKTQTDHIRDKNSEQGRTDRSVEEDEGDATLGGFIVGDEEEDEEQEEAEAEESDEEQEFIDDGDEEGEP